MTSTATTLVIQSHRDPLPARWLQVCIDSVAHWARINQFDYLFLGDEIFRPIDSSIHQKLRQQPVILSDLARLMALQQGLLDGYQTVVWCDADFLIFRPERFELIESAYALGREIWIQPQDSRLRVYRKVHNAFLMFRQDNHFLDFYYDTAVKLVQRNQGRFSPQFIGPKLLTALHNIVGCPVMESAGMLSPAVISDLLQVSDGSAVKLFRESSMCPPAAANLSASLTAVADLGEVEMERLIQRLLDDAL